MKATMIRNFAAAGLATMMLAGATMASAADWRDNGRDHTISRGHDDVAAIGIGVGLLIGAAILSNQHHHDADACRDVVVYDHRDWRDRDWRDRDERRFREIRREREEMRAREERRLREERREREYRRDHESRWDHDNRRGW